MRGFCLGKKNYECCAVDAEAGVFIGCAVDFLSIICYNDGSLIIEIFYMQIGSIFSQKKTILAFSAIIAIALCLPAISFGGKTQKLYVDSKASGSQDGSSNHPYKTIAQAMDKANEDTKIYLSSGTYIENVNIRKGVEIYGGSPKKVSIKAKNSNKPAVEMAHDTKINNIAVDGGRNGIYVHGKSRAIIEDCVIKNSKHDGIHVNASKSSDKYKVQIVGNEIKNNDKAGVYIEGSKTDMIDNEVHDNKGDGVDLEKGVKIWMHKNVIRDNNGAGTRIALDYSDVWAKKNTFRDNKKNGIEVNAYGASGRVDLNTSKFINNHQHGIAKIQRGMFNKSVWNGLTVTGDTLYSKNDDGSMSGIIVLR